ISSVFGGDTEVPAATVVSAWLYGGAGMSVRCSTAGSCAVAARSVIDEGGYLPVGRAHAHTLVALQRLALCLERRRNHDLRAVELRQVLVAAGRHRRAQSAEQ